MAVIRVAVEGLGPHDQVAIKRAGYAHFQIELLGRSGFDL